ncbi:MAG: DUF4350 domain-containing protein [Verrucomicrobiota bacterium]
MKRKQFLVGLGIAAMASVLMAGFYLILERRLSDGDLYAHYASFRADPLGTSAFYETLERMPSYLVRRNIDSLQTIENLDSETALLLLGYPRDAMRDLRVPSDSPVIEAVEKGTRLVLALNPGFVPEKFQPKKTDEEEDWLERRDKLREARGGEPGEEEVDEETGTGNEGLEVEELEFERRIDSVLGPPFSDRFTFSTESPSEFQRPEEGWETAWAEENLADAKEEPPAWFSQFRFEELGREWKTVLEIEGAPVVIERDFGAGSIVVLTDTYFVSNEALHLGGSIEFLLWLLGEKKTVVFDETIHGVEETGGAMKLMREYRIHGFFFGLVLVISLWAWRSASPLAPGSLGEFSGASNEAVSGKDLNSGFVRLLRKSVPSKELLATCENLWLETKLVDPGRGHRKTVQKIVKRHESDPKSFGIVSAYREIVSSLRRR